MRKRLQETALTVGAILGTLCLLGGIAAIAFGITPLVFTSGSMEPSIPTGSVAMSRTVPATDVHVGDVVSVHSADGSRITHRVDEIGTVTGNSVVLNLKGDANAAVDSEQYVVVDADRVLFSVPYLGYVVAWLSTPFAWITGGVLASVLLWVAFAPDVRRLSQPSGRHAAAASVAAVVVVSSIVGVGFSRSTATEAAPLDVATAQASITPVVLGRPASFTCANAAGSAVDLSWPNVTRATGYRLVFTPPLGANPTTIDVTPSATATTTYRPAAGLTNLLNLGDIRVTLQTVYNNFISSQSVTQTIVALTSLAYACKTAGTVTPAAAAPRSARIAEAPASTSTTEAPAPSTAATSSPAETATTTTTTVPETSAAPTTTTSAPEAQTAEPLVPDTTTPAVTTPPPPPASAFIAEGSSTSSGGYTAGVDGGSLVITDTIGRVVYEGPASSSDRYGSGAVWSSDGSLYVLSDASPVQISPAEDGTFAAVVISPAALPSDISALL
ncbi:signal peptidase I [Rhodococcoides kyotonense]|uniref:Signal peptidase I n=1 Tax=Rhodococcoides kyotonense TaxID=398843 RepID=A0A239J742_9NOCA|nr:signal peptidase I [Rhodococcus kyotonensis]SNT01589.1 signal peptidase I [Rhodococcus kyotonensis]